MLEKNRCGGSFAAMCCTTMLHVTAVPAHLPYHLKPAMLRMKLAAFVPATPKRMPAPILLPQSCSWLEATVGEVKRSVSTHLLDIMMNQQGLPRHLDAIKRFLLLVRR